VGVLAAGCGGGTTLSKEEYGSQLNAICADFNAKVEEIGEPTSISELADKGPQLLAELDATIAKAEKLKAPSEIRADADRFLSVVKELRDLDSDLIDAVEKNDTAAISAFGARAEALFTERDALGKKLGAPACAGEQA
jgi:hypothetical protein